MSANDIWYNQHLSLYIQYSRCLSFLKTEQSFLISLSSHSLGAESTKGLMWLNKCASAACETIKKAPNPGHHRWKQTRFFFKGMIDILEKAGGQSFQSRLLKHAPYPGKEIGFQLQAQGSTTGVTPQSAQVKAKAVLQAGLTFSINSHSLTHNTNLCY